MDEVERAAPRDAPDPEEARAIVAAYEGAPEIPISGVRNIDGQDKILPDGWVVTAADYFTAKAAVVARAVAPAPKPRRRSSASEANDKRRAVVDALVSMDEGRVLTAANIMAIPWVMGWADDRGIEEQTLRDMINRQLSRPRTTPASPDAALPRTPGRLAVSF